MFLIGLMLGAWVWQTLADKLITIRQDYPLGLIVIGGLLVGILEAMGAGYISSSYKDAIPFVLILFILFFMPRGLFGAKVTERV